MGDLAHYRMGIEYRLAAEYPGGRSLVDDDLLLVGVQVDRRQLGHQHPVADLERGIEQVAQPHVLGLQRFVLLQLGLQAQVIAAQCGVVFEQATARAGGLVEPLRGGERQVGHVVQRVGHERQGAAQLLEVMETMVEHEQGKRQQDGGHQAGGLRRALCKYRLDGNSLSACAAP